MDPKFQTSFIPKKTLIQGTPGKPPRTTNFFTLLSLIILITVVVLTIGVFSWKAYLTSHNTKLKAELDSNLQQFEPALISELSRLDNRIESSKLILSQHVALSSFFDFLGTVTLPSIRFASFKYTVVGQKITVSMTGQAQNFNAVALQAAEFSKPTNSSILKNPLFSNLNLDQSGNVLFDFSGTIDASKISYKSYLNSLNTGSTMAATSTQNQ